MPAKRTITFTVYGEPVPQGRPRARMVKGRVIMYDPAKSRHFKTLVARVAQDHVNGAMIEGPVSLTVKAYLAIPKSFSQKKREQAIAGGIHHTVKPDLKNIIASVEDALVGVILRDDSQVVNFGGSSKQYGDPPRVEVTVTEL